MFGLTPRDLSAAAALTVIATAVSVWLGLPLLGVAATALLTAALSLILFSDLRYQRIPDVLSLPLIPLGLAVCLVLWPEAFAWHLAGSGIGFAALWVVRWAYRRWRGIEGLGLGDVKLMAVAGAWAGLDYLAPITLAACVAALAVVLLHGGGHASLRTRIPLGAYLAPAIALAWLHLGAS